MSSSFAVISLLASLAVFFALPVAFHPRFPLARRGFLAAFSTGICVYLLIITCARVIQELENLLGAAIGHYPTWGIFCNHLFLFLGGLSFGSLGLFFLERRLIYPNKDILLPPEMGKQAAFMWAVIYGLLHLGGGLAMGVEYKWGDTGFALFLAFGLGLHAVLKSFSIAMPIAGHLPRVSYLMLIGFVSGMPIFTGALIGSFWSSKSLEVLFLGLASGGFLYGNTELFHSAPKKEKVSIGVGILLGFVVGLLAEMIAVSRTRVF